MLTEIRTVKSNSCTT